MRIKSKLCLLGAAASLFVLGATPGWAASLISGSINDHDLMTLTHNTRPEANALNDRGAMPDGVRYGGQLLLKRDPAQQAALRQAIQDLHDPQSPNFHHWMTNEDIAKYGLSKEDLGKVKGWLTSHGFQITGIQPDHTVIAFKGTMGQLRQAFHTDIHLLSVDGETHFANMSDPKIPRALAKAVAGVVAMNDFQPHPMFFIKKPLVGKKKPGHKYTVTAGCFPATPTGTHSASFTGHCFLVTPKDLAVIYNFNAAFTSGITGAGQTVVVLEDTNVYKVAAWGIFRNVMGIPASSFGNPTFTQVHPAGAQACADPGAVWGNDGEAILDAEYASASAPGANIVLASCSDTGTTNTGFGGYKALLNLTALATPPKIISLSYGECETLNGAASNAAFNTAYQTAAAKGISIYVSSGDESATSCDANLTRASHGIGVSGFQSSQYNISVGGTDWQVNTDRTNANAWQSYWNASNGPGFVSAKSYVPEIPWNNSCASEVTATFYTGSNVTYGTSGFCNNSFATTGNEFLSTGSGSGGPSGCATGTPSTSQVVSGTCAGWAKPTYQQPGTNNIQGLVADGVRDTPDVSLFAANGVWGSWFPFCDLDPAALGTSATANAPGCTGTDPYNWAGAGGTSFSSPIWAGIQALINQKTGQSWGDTNAQYYAIGAAEYGPTGNPSCNSSLGNAVGATCVFHDVTAGDFNVNCRAATGGVKHNCYLPSSTNGVGTTDLTNSSYAPMYRSAAGWDFTTGLGTPNVGNLLNAMNGFVVTPQQSR